MKKINIGLLILSNGWGGAEQSVFTIAQNMSKDLFKITIFANDFLYDKYDHLDNVNVVNIGKLESQRKIAKVFSLIKIRKNLFKSLKENNIDIVHARLENSLLALKAGIQKLTLPLIFTFSGEEARVYLNPKTVEQRVIHMITNEMLNNKIVTMTSVSHWLVKDFEPKQRQKILITPNGVDTSFFKQIKTKRLTNSVLYVGRYVKGKGIEDLVKIARRLKSYQFIFAGKGPLSHLFTPKNCVDVGFQSREELRALYSTTTLCVFPSYAEGMPIVGLEAMACGKAVIASYAGFSEYIEDGKDGLIIEPGNIKQIENAIIKVMGNPELCNRLGRSARRKALVYDIEKTVKNYEDLYRKVVR